MQFCSMSFSHSNKTWPDTEKRLSFLKAGWSNCSKRVEKPKTFLKKNFLLPSLMHACMMDFYCGHRFSLPSCKSSRTTRQCHRWLSAIALHFEMYIIRDGYLMNELALNSSLIRALNSSFKCYELAVRERAKAQVLARSWGANGMISNGHVILSPTNDFHSYNIKTRPFPCIPCITELSSRM